MKRIGRAALLGAMGIGLSGCSAVGVSLVSTALGLGASHQINGVSHRTFTEPQARTEDAVIEALGRMGLAISSREDVEGGRLVQAIAATRTIDVAIEPITPKATRVRSTTRVNGGFLLDGATSAEIIAQTERVLASGLPIPSGDSGTSTQLAATIRAESPATTGSTSLAAPALTAQGIAPRRGTSIIHFP
jgi:hypothetical protein